jgi:hypothetical protein
MLSILALLSPSLAALPPFGAHVSLEPTNSLLSGVRHCNYQLSTTNPIEDGNQDFSFKLVAGLSGTGISFQSVNYDTKYMCPRASLNGFLGIGDIGTECATKEDATWLPQAGLADPSNSSFASASANPAYQGLFMTVNASSTCACCEPGWQDMVLAAQGKGLSQTFVVGAPPAPPPAPPTALTVHADLPIDHRVKREFMGW